MDIFYHLFECSPDAVILVGEHGGIEMMNSQGEKMFGYVRQEYQGQLVEMLIPQPSAGHHPGHRARYLQNPHVGPMRTGGDLSALRKDGSLFPVDVTISLVETPEDKFVLAVVRDITERKRAERAQVSLIAQLQNALKEVRTLRGLLPICGYCKSICTDTGSWEKIESYMKTHIDVDFSHGICPQCYQKQMSRLKVVGPQ